MKRTLIIVLLVFLGLVLFVAGAGYTTARVGLFRPGNPFFPIQAFFEEQRALLIADPTNRAFYYIDLLDRRTEDLSAVIGTEYEFVALQALDNNLDLTIDALAEAPAGDLSDLKERMIILLVDVEETLKALTNVPSESLAFLDDLLAKISTLQAMLTIPSQGQVNSSESPISGVALDAMVAAVLGSDAPGSTPVDPQAITFPPGSPGAEHAFFPLSGKHASISCQSCHIQGQYAGTPDLCTDCHLGERPEIHYDGQCSTCHLATTWSEINMDHSLVVEVGCFSCHELDKPVQHYNGICSACHNTIAWIPASFDHLAAGATDCQSCHGDDRPANHYNGQCSACHNTSSWGNAKFNHQAAGATDCQSCHRNDKPANHYSGQCSACHNTNNWANATFSHKAAGTTDCQSCHAQDRPANHFSGQCSSCHNTNNWGDATFKHNGTGTSDCKSCHSSPSNHWSGQCSSCHNTNNWSDVKVSGHRFPMDHGDANGECSSCHNGTNQSVNCYTCHNKSETEKHHAEDDIFDIGGRCLECHPTGDKGDD